MYCLTQQLAGNRVRLWFALIQFLSGDGSTKTEASCVWLKKVYNNFSYDQCVTSSSPPPSAPSISCRPTYIITTFYLFACPRPIWLLVYRTRNLLKELFQTHYSYATQLIPIVYMKQCSVNLHLDSMHPSTIAMYRVIPPQQAFLGDWPSSARKENKYIRSRWRVPITSLQPLQEKTSPQSGENTCDIHSNNKTNLQKRWYLYLCPWGNTAWHKQSASFMNHSFSRGKRERERREEFMREKRSSWALAAAL